MIRLIATDIDGTLVEDGTTVINTEIYDIILKLRENKKWTQKELSSKLGVSTRTIISLEKGHFNPSIKVAYKCSLIFECPIRYRASLGFFRKF